MAGVSRPADQSQPRTLPRSGDKPGTKPGGGGQPPKGNSAAKRAELQRQRDKRNRIIAGVVVGLVVVAVIVGVVVQSGRSSTSKKAVVPAAANTTGGFSKGTGPVTVEEYGDFQCPHCDETFQKVGPMLDQQIAANKITYVFHNFAFLGAESVSTANAAICASTVSNDKFWSMFNWFYAHQPATENSGFWTNDQIDTALATNGITDPAVVACVKNHTYYTWIGQQNDAASKRGVTGTPTFYINNVQYTGDTTDPTAILAAITKASGGK